MGKMNLIDLFKQNQKIKEWTEHLSAPTRQLVMGFSRGKDSNCDVNSK